MQFIVYRERFTGLTWPTIGIGGLIAGGIGGIIAFVYGIGQDWFPLLALVVGGAFIAVSMAVKGVARHFQHRYEK